MKKSAILVGTNLLVFVVLIGLFEIYCRIWSEPFDLKTYLALKPSSSWSAGPSSMQSSLALPISTLNMPRYEPAPFLANSGQISDVKSKFPFFTLGHQGLHLARPQFDGISEARRIDGELIYRTRVRTDQHGFRISSLDEKATLRPQHLLLMGCSMMWGEGLNDEESLAFQLNSAQSEYFALNRGFPGQGPIEVFLQMQRPEFMQDVSQEKGIGAYFFIPNHLDRTIGTMGIFRSWGRNLHAFQFDDETLVPKGPFAQEELVRYWFLRALSQSAIFVKFGIDLPIKTEEHDFIFSKIIREIKREYLRLKPQGRFVFVFLPTASEDVSRLLPYFEQMGIEYLPYHLGPTFDQLTAEQTAIPFDGHPTREYNRLLVEVLKKDLLSGSIDR